MFEDKVDAQSNGGYTPLMDACQIGNYNICHKLMIELHAHPFKENHTKIQDPPNSG